MDDKLGLPKSVFWDFSLAVYGKPGFPQAAIALQDRHGLNVNMLLFCLWAGANGRLLAGEETETYWDGLRYAALLSERDARVLAEYHGDADREAKEREALESSRLEAATAHADVAARRDALAAARRSRAAALERIRRDEGQRRAALA